MSVDEVGQVGRRRVRAGIEHEIGGSHGDGVASTEQAAPPRLVREPRSRLERSG